MVVNCNGNGQCFDTSTRQHHVPVVEDHPRPHSLAQRSRHADARVAAAALADRRQRDHQALAAARRIALAAAPLAARVHPNRRATSPTRSTTRCRAAWRARPARPSARCKVDVPDFRAQFLELYHRRYARPIGDYFTGLLERMLPLLRQCAAHRERAHGQRLGRALHDAASRASSTRPLLDAEPARRASRSTASRSRELAALQRCPKDGTRAVVVVLQDAFTTFYEPGVLEASCLLCAALGFEPHVLPYFENGKALHIKGFLRAFGRVVARNTDAAARTWRARASRWSASSRPSCSPTATNTRSSSDATPGSACRCCKSGWPSKSLVQGRARAAGGNDGRALRPRSACCRTAPSRRS